MAAPNPTAVRQTSSAAQPPIRRAPTPAKQGTDWVNLVVMACAHALAVVAVVHLVLFFSWWTLATGIVWFALCGFAITGGYHRLFAHRAYKASRPLRALFLFFGAASVQNSALKWCDDHRLHHARTDTERDPYNIRRGFWWAHIGWVLSRMEDRDPRRVTDLSADPLVRFQDRWFLALALVAGALVPFALGLLWGDPWGALLTAGFLRLVLQWHATFAVNSLAHLFGSQGFGSRTSARDSPWVAFLTMGEGYHNFHHRFPADYRNGVRWHHFDPTKWLVWSLAKLRLARDLQRTPSDRIRTARLEAAHVRTPVRGGGR
jgi:stearoyl-CoA desaturase (delta-9 desaturase)